MSATTPWSVGDRWFPRFVAVVLVVAVVALCGPCVWGRRAPSQIRLVLPQSFRGVVMVIEAPDAPEIPVEDGRHVVRVPDDGIVIVRDAAPLDFHSVDDKTFVRSDGTPVPDGDVVGVAALPHGTPCVFGGGAHQRSAGGVLSPWGRFWLVGEAGRRDEVNAGVDAAYDAAVARVRAR